MDSEIILKTRVLTTDYTDYTDYTDEDQKD